MTRYFLKRIQIEGFRGINNADNPLDLHFREDAVNSVFAPNALGKSSIFEALYYAIHGHIPKLDDLPTVDRGSEYYCNLFHPSRRAIIALTFTSNDDSKDIAIEVKREPDGTRIVQSPSGYPDPENLLNSFQSELTLLDHKTFQKFIEDTPLIRGRSFSALLGGSKLSEFRQVLNVLSNAGNINTDFKLSLLETNYNNRVRQRDSVKKRINSNYERITGVEDSDLSDHDKIVEDITTILKDVQLLKPFFEEKTILDVNFDDVRTAIKKAEGSEKRQELSTSIQLIGGLEKLEAVSDESLEQKQLRQHIQEKNEALKKTRGPLFKSLYERVKEVLESDKWDDHFCCPACNSRLQNSLFEVIIENLKQYDMVQQADQGIAETWNNSKWIDRLRNLENFSAFQDKSIEKSYSNFYERFRNKDIQEEDLNTAIEHLLTLENLRQATLSELKIKNEEIEKSLPVSLVSLTQQVEYSEQLKLSIEEYKNLASDSDIANKIKKIKRWKEFVETATVIFSSAETAYSSEKTKSIDTQYSTMYSEITKNPDITPKLKKAAGTENLHLQLEKFYGLSDLAATALLPESYRNAFAISLYLCAALNDKTKAQFMVLDDITSSFDAGHQYALMELIRNEIALPGNPNGIQVIILSHDGLLEKYFDTLSNTPGWHHQRLRGLPPRGHLLSQAQDANHLRSTAEKILSENDIVQASPLIRQYLEFKILEIIQRVNIPVPYDFSMRDDRKMAQNGLDAIKDALTLHKNAGTLIMDQNQVDDFQNVCVPTLITNWINHYATGITTSLSPYVLLNVLDTIDKVSDCFKYQCSCSGTTRKRFYKNLSKKHCNC
ncbi:MAG: AAA family ATPase [Candidatus Celaenobacter polaris]|nr:AAA family ATPase [Candidatus Celaenobacter polaris]